MAPGKNFSDHFSGPTPEHAVARATVLCGVVFWPGTRKCHRMLKTHPRAHSWAWLESMISRAPRAPGTKWPLEKTFPTTFPGPTRNPAGNRLWAPPEAMRLRRLKATHTAMGSADAFFRSISFRLQTHFEILTDEGRRMGPRRNPPRRASQRLPGSNHDPAAPWMGYLGGPGLGRISPKNLTLAPLETILSIETTGGARGWFLSVL